MQKIISTIFFYKAINKYSSFSHASSPFKNFQKLYSRLRFHELFLAGAIVRLALGIHQDEESKQTNEKQHTSIVCFHTVNFCLWEAEQSQKNRGGIATLDLPFVFITHHWEFSGRVPRKSYFISYNLCVFFSQRAVLSKPSHAPLI